MKIKLSKSQWEKMGGGLSKQDILREASDVLDRAEKLLHVANQLDLVIELQQFNMKVVDRINHGK